VTNATFSRALAKALHRPAIMCIPARPLRVALGSMADEVLLGGQRVLPARAASSGFRFLYPELADALAEIIPPAAGPARSRDPAAKREPYGVVTRTTRA
jgi:NAD dependent epimerase/dehydratase family enzyme